MRHFVTIGVLKLELQSGNAELGSNSTIFRAVWPWNLKDDLEQDKSEGFESCDWPLVRKRPIWVKISDVSYRVTLKFDGWPWKTIGHLSFAVSSFVQHFIAIGEFKMELQSGNAQFDGWPWKTIGHLYYATWSSMHHFVAIGEFKLELQSGNAQFGSKLTIFRAVWPCNLTYDLEKQYGTSSMLLQALCIIL